MPTQQRSSSARPTELHFATYHGHVRPGGIKSNFSASRASSFGLVLAPSREYYALIGRQARSLLSFTPQLGLSRVGKRRLGGRVEGRVLLWVQTSLRWVQNEMRAAVFKREVAQPVNLGPVGPFMIHITRLCEILVRANLIEVTR